VSSRDATPVVGIPPVLEPPAPPPPSPDQIPETALRGKVRRAPRRARLYVYRLDAWSVMKVAFMLSVAMAIVIVSAVAGTWYLLDYSGVIATMSRNVDEVIGSGTTTFDLEAVLAFDRVMGLAVVIAPSRSSWSRSWRVSSRSSTTSPSASPAASRSLSPTPSRPRPGGANVCR